MSRADVRKLRSFLVDLGTEMPFGARWRPRQTLRDWDHVARALELIHPRLAIAPRKARGAPLTMFGSCPESAAGNAQLACQGSTVLGWTQASGGSGTS